jgi:hypothetical protein
VEEHGDAKEWIANIVEGMTGARRPETSRNFGGCTSTSVGRLRDAWKRCRRSD